MTGQPADAAAPDRSPLQQGSEQPASAVHDVALLDLDGVVYVGADAVPGVPAALAEARDRGMRLGFVTNNASRRPEEVAGHLTELGVPADVDDVITSAQAAATVVARRLGPGARVLPVGGPGVAAALTAAGLTVVDRAEDEPAAVVQGYGREVGWAQLAEAVVAVRRGARHVATNADATIPSPRGPLPGNGALVGVVSAVTGQQPEVTGKPDPAMHEECVRRTGARTPLVVGDRLDTDIEGARRAGAASLLVLTGVTDPPALLAAGPLHRPDLLAADAGGLLVAHPAVGTAEGGWRCGRWTVTADGDALRLGSAGAGAGDGEGGGGSGEGRDDRPATERELDGLRALCVAHWSAHPDGAPAPRTTAADDAARDVLRRWGLAGQP
jgi:glycerol-1-phosphatase